MSNRRTISFSEKELELLEYFDNNGKSTIAKTALKFYMENKDNVINEATFKILERINIKNQSPNMPSTSENKFSKLKK